MNCSNIATLTRWECTPSGVNSVRAVSPIPLGYGGQCVAFYVAQPTPTSFYLTDASETAMHAEQLGIQLTKSRLEALNRTAGVELAEFDLHDWSIEASGPIENLQAALWDAVKLALALAFKKSWLPKFSQAKFQAIVLQELEAQLGMEKIVRSARVQGASGHIIEFPAGIKRSDGTIAYVQPVALDNSKINWPSIYEFHGKLFDLKSASAIDNRIAIIESGAPEADFGRASSFLANAAAVMTIDGIADLATMYI